MTQKEKVLKHLKAKKKISSMDAFTKYHITRLAAIIFDLRDEGYDIETDMVHKKTKDGEHVHYAVYRMG